MLALKIISIALFIVTIGFGFYVNLLYARLNSNGAVTSAKRISLKVLDEALLGTKNKAQMEQLLRCRMLYKKYLRLMYFTFTVVALTIIFLAATGG